ncbi:hypothetical protein [Methylotuvimicrobium alcaliphilum]|uniref:Lipoprotein n=1 Tax=Methylotuvimicrobium alcaliphilum (strain DSM 19304 / NCIMB 14124 / VKM B-2133 / 20Z) TaxID=1091494 RepID=G4SZL6_META2|nr:hypothetical protein [Methylotuvimicrobium alcaliphilum]CCE24457.1 conserved protein of unknown function [Methylotuvimicrobium alcaliphilum 20Z]
MMSNKTFKLWFSRILVLILCFTLTGCMYWWRAFQTYRQLDQFDRNFAVANTDDFTLQFKNPIMYSDDFVSLSGLRPSYSDPLGEGRRWSYWFHKVDRNQKPILPEVKFFFNLDFNKENRLIAWTFSELFLRIAPAEFLEVSLRSLAGAEINEGDKQMRASADHIEKIAASLPKKESVIAELGEPLEIIDESDEQEIYLYHFLLETMGIKKGYEDRALSVVKLTFDKKTDELIRMAGRFAGVKLSIKYRKYLEETQASL